MRSYICSAPTSDPDLVVKAAEAMYLRLVEVTEPAGLGVLETQASWREKSPRLKEQGLAVLGWGVGRARG
jgi:hypothetical protein